MVSAIDAIRNTVGQVGGPRAFHRAKGVGPTDPNAETYSIVVSRGGSERTVYVLARSEEEARELVRADRERGLLDRFVSE